MRSAVDAAVKSATGHATSSILRTPLQFARAAMVRSLFIRMHVQPPPMYGCSLWLKPAVTEAADNAVGRIEKFGEVEVLGPAVLKPCLRRRIHLFIGGWGPVDPVTAGRNLGPDAEQIRWSPFGMAHMLDSAGSDLRPHRQDDRRARGIAAFRRNEPGVARILPSRSAGLRPARCDWATAMGRNRIHRACRNKPVF
jgi:hypothetical protein